MLHGLPRRTGALKPGRVIDHFLLDDCGRAAAGGFFVTSSRLTFPRLLGVSSGTGGDFLLLLIILFRDKTSLSGRKRSGLVVLYAAFLALVGDARDSCPSGRKYNLKAERNFFGILRVLELDKDIPEEHRYTLMHGRIDHGYQMLNPEKRDWPTSYFGAESGVGIASSHQRLARRADLSRLRIGVIGLEREDRRIRRIRDYVRFYEINPEVLRLSDAYFTYRKDSRAR